MDDIELRKWAVEQAVMLHQRSGLTTTELVRQAGELMSFVKPPEKKETA